MSSSTQGLFPDLDLGNTFGALFIGAILAAVLFGITNVQAFIYFQTHRGTAMTSYKFLVIWLWMLDALHLALITHCVYYYLVTNYANISVLTEIVWSFKLHIVMCVIIVYGVHIMYACRIWILTKHRSRALPVIVGIIVILTSGVAIALIWAIYQCHVFSDLIETAWATYIPLGTFAFDDFIIASSLCYILATSCTGFSNMDSFLIWLMVYIINTGLLTNVTSMVAIITFAVMPSNLIFIGVEFLIAGLYINSYLALLNAGYYLQPNDSDTVNISEFRAHQPSMQSTELEAENPARNPR
ncbi:hypothetical protein K503DRAFT_805635 [Rhizopogon vinicolor AM-OR11-026]|uniref:DUF6534 domain-containing protein n=1 Tax=Rhizopogon vinicolor AM-OR11-026 TaxID=1314800 RepID=A0A1B7MH78_9AGAM|nr:hypothetical protein K503DRAFT_805635 [Rhizopogon vinicolor AM-OR11-026]